MYEEGHIPSRPNAARGLIPAAMLLLAIVVTAAALALMQPSGRERQAYVAPERHTPAPTPGVAVPVDAPLASTFA